MKAAFGKHWLARENTDVLSVICFAERSGRFRPATNADLISRKTVLYGSSLIVTPFAFQKSMNLNLWCKAEVSDANRN
ncbi:hypothetical protein, partial [Agrobacterium salinitolerans]